MMKHPRLTRAFAVILIFVMASLGLEMTFRIYCHLSGKGKYGAVTFKQIMTQSWFLPHPYLIYIFKPHNTFMMDAFDKPHMTTNQFSFRSTLEYDVMSVPKLANTLRIATIGGSTTMGVNDDDKIWPYLIGKNLSSVYPDMKIEVLNEGMMGYTSLDNLIDLAVRVIDFNCDVYILYLGINDYLAAAPLEVYRSDYSHFRKTLWESLSFSAVELLPEWMLKSKVINVLANKTCVKNRQDLLSNTGTTQFRTEYKALDENQRTRVNGKIQDNIIRNVSSMVGIIREHNPRAVIILSSFYHTAPPEHVLNLNDALRQYAKNANVSWVDVAGLLLKDQGMTFDYGHFTEKGDRRVAEIFSDAVKRFVPNPKESLLGKQ